MAAHNEAPTGEALPGRPRSTILLAALSILAACDTDSAAPERDGSASAERSEKVDVCHLNGSGNINVLSVSSSAVSSHLAHGDHLAGTYFLDADGDGVGDSAETAECLYDDYVAVGGDCDDDDDTVSPDAEEVCGDGIDDDCDGRADNACPSSVSDADLTIAGEFTSDNFGISLAAGDTNNDGSADLLVGAYGNDDTASAAGKAYLFLGPVTATSGADADATFLGAAQSDYLGYTTAIGDLDGDGYDDVVVGAYGATLGEAYVYYGPISGEYDTSDASAILSGTGSSSELSRYLLSAADDLDGDGDVDLMIGAHTYNSSKGAIGVFWEPTSNTGLDEADLFYEGTATTGYAGYGGAGVGDVDGDGVPDVAFGEPNANQAYLFYGNVSGTIDSSSADVVFDNTDRTGDYPGSRIDGGDLNGDGNADVMVTIKYDDITATSTGTVAIFYSPTKSSIDMYDADYILSGANTYTYLGQQTDGFTIDDLDGDGNDDLIFGASSDDSLYTNAGGAFVFYGPLSGTEDTDSYDRAFFGSSTYQYTGRSSMVVADLDGDGDDDLSFGAYGAGSFSGRAYIFSGTNF